MNIITCPYCPKKTNLAEITPEGYIKIIRLVKEDERSWYGGEQIIYSTIIKAKEFELICGNCNRTVIYKEYKPTTPQFNVLMAWGTIMTYYAKGSN